MAHVYRLWFTWGFFSSVAWAGFWMLESVSDKMLGRNKNSVIGCLGCSICVQTIVWFVLGILWRFQTAGKVVSGDML